MEDPLEEELRSMLKELSKGNTKHCDQVDGATGEFGYDRTNPIPAEAQSYCCKLRCPEGHGYWFHRPESVGTGPDGHFIDCMELLCFSGESHIELYFDMYNIGSSELIPKNLGGGIGLGVGATSNMFR